MSATPLVLLLSLLSPLAQDPAPPTGTSVVDAPASADTTDAERLAALAERPLPAWFRDAKLGIFIHWGVYSVPSYGRAEDYAEWFLSGLLRGDPVRVDFLRSRYGEDATYSSLAQQFRAELFDPDDWAELFRASGARYVVLTSKHHDGFALWPSEHASMSRGFPWNATEVGPERDLVGELSESVRATGLRMGLYYSLPEWQHPLYAWGSPRPSQAGGNGDSVERYVAEHMQPQFRDVMSRYRPSVVFADGEWDHPASTWGSAELLEWLFDESGCPDDLVVNDRWGAGSDVGFKTPEYSAGPPPGDRPWVECRGLGRSFGLNRAERLEAYLTPGELVHFLARAVSRGGGLLLNVGPAADGRIPLLQQERLRQLGAWLAVNGEAIYAAEPWTRTGEWTTSEVRRVDAAIDFDWVRNAPTDRIEPDRFEAEWSGYLQAPENGRYRFALQADDRASLWLDGQEVATAERPGELELVAGERLPLRVSFAEDELNARCRLLWSRDGADPEVVPPGALFQTADGPAAGLEACYRSPWQTLAFTQSSERLFAILFDWPGRAVTLEVPAPRPGSSVRLLGLERDLPWTWSDGQLRVDLSSIGPGELTSEYAWSLEIQLAP